MRQLRLSQARRFKKCAGVFGVICNNRPAYDST